MIEQLAQIKKQLPKPTEAEGGDQSLALATPEASASNSSIHKETNHILSSHEEQLRYMQQELDALREGHDRTTQAVYKLQDKTGIDRKKPAAKQANLSQYENQIAEQKKQAEALALAQQKPKAAITSVSGLI